VLVPRYLNYHESFTSLYKLPRDYSLNLKPSGTLIEERGVLELKGTFIANQITTASSNLLINWIFAGNPLPPIKGNLVTLDKKKFITNVLLSEARKEFFKNKTEKSE